MAMNFSHRSVPWGMTVFIFFACVASRLQGAEVRAGSVGPDDEAIGNFRSSNFDEGNKWVFPRSEESPSADDPAEKSADDEEFDRLLQRSRGDWHESRRQFFPRKKSEEDIFDRHFKDLFDLEDDPAKSEAKRGSDSLTILTEKPVVLPARFVYVAREFYRSWFMPSIVRKSGLEPEKGAEDGNNYDASGRQDGQENGQVPGETKLGLGWRNIIDAPTGDCPPGERKDHNGRCRMTLW